MLKKNLYNSDNFKTLLLSILGKKYYLFLTEVIAFFSPTPIHKTRDMARNKARERRAIRRRRLIPPPRPPPRPCGKCSRCSRWVAANPIEDYNLPTLRRFQALEVHNDFWKCFGAGMLCFLCYSLLKYSHSCSPSACQCSRVASLKMHAFFAYAKSLPIRFFEAFPPAIRVPGWTEDDHILFADEITHFLVRNYDWKIIYELQLIDLYD